ncbi:MAG: DUF4376 domain-containing protein [Alistipes sp.]|nr:DUF4376 domain-containing protein [Alistipes sp.]
MDKYIKDGRIMRRNRIVVTEVVDGIEMNVYNPTAEQVLAAGWELWVEPTPTADQLLRDARNNKLQELSRYDSSPAVNEFYMNGNPLWLDKATRVGLALRFDAEVANDLTETTLWANSVSYTLPLEMARGLLNALEMYASACYDNTQKHSANIKALVTIEEIQAYNFTTGYPEKLQFAN